MKQIASEQQRRDELTVAIEVFAKKGYRVMHRDDFSAQLIRPKQFNFLVALAGLLFLVVGLLIYLLYFLSKRDEVVHIHIDGYATAHVTRGAG